MLPLPNQSLSTLRGAVRNPESWPSNLHQTCLGTELGAPLDLAPIGGRLVVFCSRTAGHFRNPGGQPLKI